MSGRIVITGAGGLVGRVLAGQAGRQGRDVVALTSSDWDITEPGTGERHLAAGDIVVNCAAITNVDLAEAVPERSRAVNAVGAGNVAHACARVGASLIHLSTDYVFGGDSTRPYDIDDEPAPLSVYGRTKLAGEHAVLAALPDAHVVRTSWIFEGGNGADFAAVMRRAAAGSGDIEMVADQIGSPTYVGDLCAALLQIADGGVRGPLLHAANAGSASRFDQAQAVFAELGADPGRVHPISGDRHPRPAPRPSYSALAATKSTAAGLTPLRPWRAALAEALATMGGSLL
ncbi:dTDP-4-dehydrorhamnose reductase [Mycolicibacterium sp. PAM1]|uniref:dTDP-4-dehydrorhamnose reductase n=1 Tax=Mycolicibacterium sp. PAM1 TaxID=2853535 RepID=UPI001C3E2198|nr:dTDP-4-dehydrorhamnose reductase [Mycolicibacterium sp. PAM1]MBV5245408.1 dTDP-4-dehydrorhamnose reductase [Mycolicibacterium sp. PAM1]